MTAETFELFIHSQGAKPKVAVAGPQEVLRDVLVRTGIMSQGQEDLLVFVGEWDEALNERDDIDDGEDSHPPVDLSLTTGALELLRHRHVHVHKCKRVAVEVHFNGLTKRHRFSPATTIAVITKWARTKFKLDPAAGAEYVLQICNTTKQPRPSDHLGELVDVSTCAICFNLVKEITPQG